MKISPMSQEDMMAGCCGSEPQFPYGTRIDLDNEAAVGAGYDKFKAGDYVTFTGVAFVTRKSESADADDALEGEGADKCLSLQITEINLKKTKVDMAEMAKQLYGETGKGSC